MLDLILSRLQIHDPNKFLEDWNMAEAPVLLQTNDKYAVFKIEKGVIVFSHIGDAHFLPIENRVGYRVTPKAKDIEYSTTIMSTVDVYPKGLKIPIGWKQGPFQCSRPSGYEHYLTPHGGVLYLNPKILNSDSLNEPRIWLEKI